MLRPGDRVRTTRDDPPHHNRVPRYIRGAAGEVVEPQGEHPRPDERSRGLEAPAETVYTVRFLASELFGSGDHHVTVDIWQSHLESLGER
jgi:hypothetical protein